MKNRPLRDRLGFGTSGISEGWKRERSFRTQAICGLASTGVLLLLRPAPICWAVVAIVVALVLALELINSSLEAVIDLLHPAHHENIRIAKDMLAGAVLVISFASLVVAAALGWSYLTATSGQAS